MLNCVLAGFGFLRFPLSSGEDNVEKELCTIPCMFYSATVVLFLGVFLSYPFLEFCDVSFAMSLRVYPVFFDLLSCLYSRQKNARDG